MQLRLCCGGRGIVRLPQPETLWFQPSGTRSEICSGVCSTTAPETVRKHATGLAGCQRLCGKCRHMHLLAQRLGTLRHATRSCFENVTSGLCSCSTSAHLDVSGLARRDLNSQVLQCASQANMVPAWGCRAYTGQNNGLDD